jgi:hypothetical protein
MGAAPFDFEAARAIAVKLRYPSGDSLQGLIGPFRPLSAVLKQQTPHEVGEGSDRYQPGSCVRFSTKNR